jgi:4-amino-4-deoxy-L-arabinose transferase-like glycosyltransferase
MAMSNYAIRIQRFHSILANCPARAPGSVLASRAVGESAGNRWKVRIPPFPLVLLQHVRTDAPLFRNEILLRTILLLFRSPYFLLTMATVATLLPFIDKAFHIDDPLFLWTARQIQVHPLDFYGFHVNWYWFEMPMAEVTKNPPLAAYYIALTASLLGWSEVALHSAFLIWPVGVVLGTYQLAKAFGTRPALAALTTLWTPVFLVSSTNLMSDTMMLCFWTWAMVFWMRGLREKRISLLCLSGVLISLSALTKYFGISLIPLLAVYSLADQRRLGRWLWALLIPVVVLGGYHWATHELYGRGLLVDAIAYPTEFRGWFHQQTSEWCAKPVLGLAFAGGCAVCVLFFAPALWSRGGILAGIGLIAILSLAVSSVDQNGVYAVHDKFEVQGPLAIQLAVCAVAGVSVLVLAVADLARRRDAQALVLFLWIAGTFLFATVLNWTINGRSILPMMPAVSLLIARRIEVMQSLSKSATGRVAWLLFPAVAVALAVASADYRLANSMRQAVTLVHERLPPGERTWFLGHWGFQYYMAERGARILDIKSSAVKPGDFLICPRFNTNVSIRPNSPALRNLKMTMVQHVDVPTCPWLATMNSLMGAGFYATKGFGLLPFVCGQTPAEQYAIVQFHEISSLRESEGVSG